MSKLLQLKDQIKIIFKDASRVSFTLFKILIPTLIIVKILEDLGFIKWLGLQIAPFMSILGLPPEAGLVWTATMCTNLYTGLAVFADLPATISWTQAQVTVLATIMLLAHNLPVEVRVAQRSGCRVITNIFMRLGGAMLLAIILNQIYLRTNYLQNPAVVVIPTQHEKNALSIMADFLKIPIQFVMRHAEYSQWVADKIVFCFQVFLVILALIAILKILRAVGIEKVINKLLQPVLKILGIKPAATSITIVGITLGLAYGGGLLIQEAESGKVDKNDVFASVSLLSLCHSQIEDTFLVMLLGAHLSGILWGRLVFALIVVYFLVRFQRRCSSSFSDKYLVTDVIKKE